MVKNTAPPARMSKGVISKSEAIEILSGIARNAGNAATDRIRAIETLARMNGWNQPLRVELSAADSRCYSTCCGLSLLMLERYCRASGARCRWEMERARHGGQ